MRKSSYQARDIFLACVFYLRTLVLPKEKLNRKQIHAVH